MNKLTFRILIIMVLLLSLSIVTSVSAQDDSPITDETPVTDDDVNEIAGRIYCPVCEGITLEACQTKTCEEWKDWIRERLGTGQNEEQIRIEFWEKYGDQVLGIPKDPLLRFLSMDALWIAIIILLVGGFVFYINWQRSQNFATEHPSPTESPSATDDDDYMAQIERDLSE